MDFEKNRRLDGSICLTDCVADAHGTGHPMTEEMVGYVQSVESIQRISNTEVAASILGLVAMIAED